MSSERSKSESNTLDIDWTPENEIKLFYALRGHKPVGVAKNFHMISILDEFVKLTEKEVSSKIIWDRLAKLYDMDTLHENENLPFPSNSVPFNIEGIKEFDELLTKAKVGTDNKSDKVVDIKEETEVNSISGKTKTKTQDLNKSNTKVKTENEKSSKCDRKEDNCKQSEKSDETDDKSNRSSKKQTIKSTTTELRSASHNSGSGAKKRK